MREFTNLWLPHEVLEAFPPDRDALGRLIHAEVSDQALRSVAASDNRTNPHDEFRELKWRRDGGVRPERSGFGESLSLFFYTELDDARSLGMRQFQLARAFCAYEWLDHVPGKDPFDDPYDYTFPVLMEASTKLGATYCFALTRLLTWTLRNIGSKDVTYPEKAFALFAAVACEAPSDDSNANLLAQWLDRLSLEFECDDLLDQIFSPHNRYSLDRFDTAWQKIGARNLVDRLPLESELRFVMDQFLEGRAESDSK